MHSCMDKRTSCVGFSTASFFSSFLTARFTVSWKVESMSSCLIWMSSTTAGASFSDFFDATDGRTSALSLPLVPQETSCLYLSFSKDSRNARATGTHRLQNA